MDGNWLLQRTDFRRRPGRPFPSPAAGDAAADASADTGADVVAEAFPIAQVAAEGTPRRGSPASSYEHEP